MPAQRSPAETHVLRHAKDLIHAQLVEVWRLLAERPLLDLYLLTATIPALMVRLQQTARKHWLRGQGRKTVVDQPGFSRKWGRVQCRVRGQDSLW